LVKYNKGLALNVGLENENTSKHENHQDGSKHEITENILEQIPSNLSDDQSKSFSITHINVRKDDSNRLSVEPLIDEQHSTHSESQKLSPANEKGEFMYIGNRRLQDKPPVMGVDAHVSRGNVPACSGTFVAPCKVPKGPSDGDTEDFDFKKPAVLPKLKPTRQVEANQILASNEDLKFKPNPIVKPKRIPLERKNSANNSKSGDEPIILSALQTSKLSDADQVVDAQKYFTSRSTSGETPLVPQKNKKKSGKEH